jgi:hypothetical protein
MSGRTDKGGTFTRLSWLLLQSWTSGKLTGCKHSEGVRWLSGSWRCF